MTRSIIWISSGLTLAGLVACVEPSMPEASDGRAFFKQNCTDCHGQGGKGDGPMAGEVGKRPTDLTVLARGNGGTFPTARALSYIWGDPEGGHLARVMPQFGPSMADDLVPVMVDGIETPTPRALAGLLEYMEAIQR